LRRLGFDNSLMVIALSVAVVVALAVIAYLLAAGRRTRIDQGSAEQLRDQLAATVAKLHAELNQQAITTLSEQAKAVLSGQQELASAELKGRQEQIEASLKRVREDLERFSKLVGDVDRRQSGAIEELRGVILQGSKQTELLRQETARLKEVLGGNQTRGQWAERMADDVLRAAGMVPGVQYTRQERTDSGKRPDFTFFLDGAVLHMDVKAPLANFQRYLEATDEREREEMAKAFCRDLRKRIDEVASRDYIAPDEGTIEFALMFLPTEQIFSFIQEREPALLDLALSKRVVVCSPLTLFAVLKTIQQIQRSRQLAARAEEVIEVLQAVQREWEGFSKDLEDLGKKLDTATKAYTRLAERRFRQMGRALDRVDQLALGPGTGRELPSGEESG
jgi:DNA recombination protein RmuC